jgi:hypothetical protein
MIEFTASDFQSLCAAEPVRGEIATIEEKRRAAVRKSVRNLLIGLALGAAAVWTLLATGWEAMTIVVGFLFFIGAIVGAVMPLSAASEGLKHPVLEAIAARAGMEYFPGDFTPPVFASAQRLLFGAVSSASFTDLFNGKDEDGHGYAVYEACLSRRSGKNSVTVFSGQVYALQRRPKGSAITAIVPDRKIFNFFKPASDMERVRIEGDEEFEKKFEVYSTASLEARSLLFASELRALLLELRKIGRVHVFLSPDEVLVAVWGKDRFEPGSMLRSRPGEERARMMFDDVCASLEVLRRLRRLVG